MHSIQNHIIHQFSQKDKSVSLPYHQNQVKMFHMLQNEQTNYPQTKLAVHINIKEILYGNHNHNNNNPQKKKKQKASLGI